jgi:hypothetical protein
VCDRGAQGYGSKELLIAIAVGGAVSLSGTAFAGAACVPASPTPPICLTGTITSPGVNVAMVERAGSAGVQGLKLGDTILDWRLLEIGPKYIRLGQGAQTVTLDLSGTVPVAAEAPASSAAAAAPHIKKGPMRRLQAWAARGEREPPK